MAFSSEESPAVESPKNTKAGLERRTGPQYYEVFARKDSTDPLTHIGSVEAPNDDLAEVRAWYVYDQHHWQEMCVVRTEAVVPVRPRPGDVIRIKAV